MDIGKIATFGTRRRISLTLRDGLTVVLAYCWATKSGGPSSATNPFKFAFHSYDASLRNNPDHIEAGIFAANGLNAGMSSEAISNILAAHAANQLPDLRSLPPIWKMDIAKLNSDPMDSSPEGLLWQWFRTMKAINEVGGAVSAKVAFHGAPDQMPLWDSVVGKFWSSGSMWGEIAGNIVTEQDWLEELERLVEHFRQTYRSGSAVLLSRLRLVDVITWLEGKGQFAIALQDGRSIISAT